MEQLLQSVKEYTRFLCYFSLCLSLGRNQLVVPLFDLLFCIHWVLISRPLVFISISYTYSPWLISKS